MTEYAVLWNAQMSTHHVIAKDDYDDYWYVVLTAPDRYRGQQVADALTLKEAQLD